MSTSVRDLNAATLRTWLRPTTRRIGRTLAISLWVALIAPSIGLAAPALAQADSVSLEVAGTPTQDIPLTVKVSGEIEVASNQYLFVFINTKWWMLEYPIG